MEIRGELNYKRAIILDEKRMRDLDMILLKYFGVDKLIYEAELKNKSNILFSSLDELLSFDNFDSRKIKALNITAISKNKNYYRITISYFDMFLMPIGYINTFKCHYTFEKIEDETNFLREIKDFLKKSTAKYWVLGKFRLVGFLFLVAFLLPVISYAFGFTNNNQTTSHLSSFAVFIVLVSTLAIIGLSGLVDKYFFCNIFPPIVFDWGEEKRNQDKKKNRRANILWGIIIALIVGVLASIITNMVI